MEVIRVQYTRQEVASMLRRAGLHDVADRALAELPDPVDLDQAADWGMRHGVTRDMLISRAGGSP
jgi:hypothetical protein